MKHFNFFFLGKKKRATAAKNCAWCGHDCGNNNGLSINLCFLLNERAQILAKLDLGSHIYIYDTTFLFGLIELHYFCLFLKENDLDAFRCNATLPNSSTMSSFYNEATSISICPYRSL